MSNLDLSEQQTSLIRAVEDTFQPTLRQQFSWRVFKITLKDAAAAVLTLTFWPQSKASEPR